MLWADESKLTQVVNNLLSNAIKYTPEKGFVGFKTYDADGFVRMEVEDTAPLIPQDRLDRYLTSLRGWTIKKRVRGLGLPLPKT